MIFMDKMKKEFKCCICKHKFTGIGNNPVPIKWLGRCCSDCNVIYVIPKRIKEMKGGTENGTR